MGEWERLKEQGKEERGGERSIKGKLGKDLNGWFNEDIEGKRIELLTLYKFAVSDTVSSSSSPTMLAQAML